MANQAVPQWSLADRLRKIRRDRHLTQEAMARELNVKAVTWAAWESGRTRPHDVVALAALIEVRFQVPAAWTLGVLSAPDISETDPFGIPAQRTIPRRRRSDRFSRAVAVL